MKWDPFIATASTILLCVALVGGCKKSADTRSTASSSSAPASRSLNVAAAADLTYALDDLGRQFRQEHPDIDLQITYGSSGNFFSQLSNHAPFDLFLSADSQYPRKLIDAGIAVRSSEFAYAEGKLVLWASKDLNLNVAGRGMKALLDPAVKNIAIANPQHAPYGRAAEAALKSEHVWDSIQSKLILGENIAQAAQFAEQGSAQIGIIALSLASAPRLKGRGDSWTIPQADYPPLRQTGVILSYARDPEAAQTFKQFLTSPRGRAILDQYGFGMSKE